MSAIYKNGIVYGGAASAANLISATGGDGTATNVQAELDIINENITSLNDSLAGIAKIYTLSKNSALTAAISVSGTVQGYIFVAGSSRYQWGILHFACSTSGNLTIQEIALSPSVTCSVANQTITFSITESQGWNVTILQMRGMATEITIS